MFDKRLGLGDKKLGLGDKRLGLGDKRLGLGDKKLGLERTAPYIYYNKYSTSSNNKYFTKNHKLAIFIIEIFFCSLKDASKDASQIRHLRGSIIDDLYWSSTSYY